MKRASIAALLDHGLTVARFGMVGAFVAVLNYLVFVGLQRAGWHYAAAAGAAWAPSVAINFLLSRRVTFGMRGQGKLREFTLFVGGAVAQFGVALAVYWLLIGILRLDPTIAFLCNTLVVASLSFAFMRLVVFPHSAHTAGLP